MYSNHNPKISHKNISPQNRNSRGIPVFLSRSLRTKRLRGRTRENPNPRPAPEKSPNNKAANRLTEQTYQLIRQRTERGITRHWSRPIRRPKPRSPKASVEFQGS